MQKSVTKEAPQLQEAPDPPDSGDFLGVGGICLLMRAVCPNTLSRMHAPLRSHCNVAVTLLSAGWMTGFEVAEDTLSIGATN